MCLLFFCIVQSIKIFHLQHQLMLHLENLFRMKRFLVFLEMLRTVSTGIVWWELFPSDFGPRCSILAQLIKTRGSMQEDQNERKQNRYLRVNTEEPKSTQFLQRSRTTKECSFASRAAIFTIASVRPRLWHASKTSQAKRLSSSLKAVHIQICTPSYP